MRAWPGGLVPVTEGRHLVRGEKLELDADVVVVGSGAGGAVVATELAEQGLDVVVLEEGGHTTPDVYGKLRPTDTMRRMGREAWTTAAIPIGDTPLIGVTMGRTVGGSSTMTGGVCYRIPAPIVDRWERELGLQGYSARGMEPYFERVEKAMLVREVPSSQRSQSTNLFDEGVTKLGHPLKAMRRNMTGCAGHSRCNFGCPRKAKLSVDISYLPRARARGVRIYSDCLVERVSVKGGRASGVEGRVLNGPRGRKGNRLSVNARAVFVCAGTLHTPGVLHRTGIGRSGSAVLGRGITLHPSFRVGALFDKSVNGWDGALQSAYSDGWEHEGVTLNSAYLPLNILAATVPGVGKAYMERIQDMGKLAVFGALVHDEAGGRLFQGPGREPWLTYRMDPRDKQRFVRGIQVLAEGWFAAGAKRVFLPIFGQAPIDSMDQMKKIDVAIPASHFESASFHPLGSARMGTDERKSIVQPTGESWELPGLWVADGSVFPTSIGVNSQLPIMAMATRIAAEFLERFRPAAER